jgi:hypothetical protein
MKTKELKVFMEGFNRFLINEHIGHDAKTMELFEKIKNDFPEFEPSVNDSQEWYSADAWLSELDGDPTELQELTEFYQDIADECGCEVKDLLVSSADTLHDDNNDLLSGRYTMNSNSKCGTFTINGQTLKGFAGVETYVVAPMCGASQGSSSSDEIGVEASRDDRFGDIEDGDGWDLNEEEEYLDEGRKFDL